MKKFLVIIAALFLLTSCANKETTEFQKLYKVEAPEVKDMTYQELLTLTESKTGVVFIGEDSKDAKELAQVFCDNLCECGVNNAYFVHKNQVTDSQLLEIFEVKALNYPVIAAYRKGELVGYYDSKTETGALDKYIYDLIMETEPAVCSEAC